MSSQKELIKGRPSSIHSVLLSNLTTSLTQVIKSFLYSRNIKFTNLFTKRCNPLIHNISANAVNSIHHTSHMTVDVCSRSDNILTNRILNVPLHNLNTTVLVIHTFYKSFKPSMRNDLTIHTHRLASVLDLNHTVSPCLLVHLCTLPLFKIERRHISVGSIFIHHEANFRRTIRRSSMTDVIAFKQTIALGIVIVKGSTSHTQVSQHTRDLLSVARLRHKVFIYILSSHTFKVTLVLHKLSKFILIKEDTDVFTQELNMHTILCRNLLRRHLLEQTIKMFCNISLFRQRTFPVHELFKGRSVVLIHLSGKTRLLIVESLVVVSKLRRIREVSSPTIRSREIICTYKVNTFVLRSNIIQSCAHVRSTTPDSVVRRNTLRLIAGKVLCRSSKDILNISFSNITVYTKQLLIQLTNKLVQVTNDWKSFKQRLRRLTFSYPSNELFCTNKIISVLICRTLTFKLFPQRSTISITIDSSHEPSKLTRSHYSTQTIVSNTFVHKQTYCLCLRLYSVSEHIDLAITVYCLRDSFLICVLKGQINQSIMYSSRYITISNRRTNRYNIL